jgi:hypothetical protein
MDTIMKPARALSDIHDTPENEMADREVMYFQTLLEEYKSIRSASLELESKLSTLKSISAGIFAALVAIQKTAIFMEITTPVFMLITSLIFSSLTMAIAHTTSMIMTLADYERDHLKPKLQALINQHDNETRLEVLNWQNYYLKPLNDRHTVNKYLFIIHALGGFIFPVFMSIAPLLYSIRLLFLRETHLQTDESALLTLAVALNIIMLVMLSYQPLSRYISARHRK